MGNRYLNKLLGESEQIIFLGRQHWLILLAKLIPALILGLSLIALVSLIGWFWWPRWEIIFGYLTLLIPLFSMSRDITIWRNKEFIVTNKRVIQIAGVFNKDVTDSSLEKVNDVKLEQSLWGRMFDYGDIEILTASDLGLNKFSRVGQPILLKTTMLNAKDKLEQGSHTLAAPNDMVMLITQLDNLRQHGLLTEEEFQLKKAQLLQL